MAQSGADAVGQPLVGAQPFHQSGAEAAAAENVVENLERCVLLHRRGTVDGDLVVDAHRGLRQIFLDEVGSGVEKRFVRQEVALRRLRFAPRSERLLDRGQYFLLHEIADDGDVEIVAAHVT